MTDKDAHSLGGSLRGHLLCQPGLTDARLAGDRSQPTTAGDGAVGKPTQKVAFRLSAYKGGALPGLVLHDLSIIPPAVTDRLRAQGNDRQDRALHPVLTLMPLCAGANEVVTRWRAERHLRMWDLINKDRTVAEQDARLSELTARMEQLGTDGPAGWARSEVQENIAQQARYLFLRRLWPEAIDGWRDPAVLSRVPAAANVLEQGASPGDLSRAMCLAPTRPCSRSCRSWMRDMTLTQRMMRRVGASWKPSPSQIS